MVPSGIVTADGVLHEVDTIIYGTGFRITDNPMAERVVGTDGRTLKEHWAAGVGMSAYCGATIPGFPNFFMLAGPNTGIGHTSLVVMIEAQVAHVTGALRALERGGAAVGRGATRGGVPLGRGHPGQGGADGVELRWVLELVSRRGRPQHHPLARLHLPLHPQARRFEPVTT